MSARRNLLGLRFGRLFVLADAKSVTTAGGSVKACWLCRCDCGKLVKVKAANLIGDVTRSCGCLVLDGSEGQKKSATVHGHTSGNKQSPTYSTWRAMMGRCCSPSHKDFPRYGATGITVCERWKVFENFLKDMGERPAGMTLDRFPDKCGGYSKDNCRWATPREQSRNQSSTKLTAEKAAEIRSDPRAQWLIALEFGVSQAAVSNIKKGKLWK